jgi:SAM-dependent methyltransferase
MFQPVYRCRICGNPNLQPILSLGRQALTGVFPRSADQPITVGPLELVRCSVDDPARHCGLVQLAHSYEASEMYGENYGYRSGLNRSMVEHLKHKVASLLKLAPLRDGDLVLDIGSNDGTTLGFYPERGVDLVGIDPSAKKFASYYKPHIRRIPELFSACAFAAAFPGRKARIVTSIAMFYDLEDPQQFIAQVASVLADDGLWHLEQSYLPLMLKANAYDTICHEHIEYYALRQMRFMFDRAGLKIVDVRLNDINGGSFALSVAKAAAPFPVNDAALASLEAGERDMGLTTDRPYAAFVAEVRRHRDELTALLHRLKAQGAKVLGYGASTKGNVILQYCGLTAAELPAIAEVNPDKFGCFTPGTRIPIVSEAEAHAMKPDYLLALPWHFRANLLQREQAFLARGGRMIFPLPKIEVVGR